MNFTANGAENVKIAYIGGGSRGWAWGLMSDLAAAEDMSGEVALYDIDFEAAQHNEIIGNKFNDAEGAKSKWSYKAVKTIGEALTNTDFVVISILPGTFDEMYSDVHTPEKYGMYQAVGDTTGPGGIVRALRTIPMFEEIAHAIEKYSPEAWVINYTNPMTICVKALYNAFPKIKAFGCCHEVFGTQKLLAAMLDETHGIKGVKRDEININVTGVNHFTWFTSAKYKNIDLFEDYAKYADKYYATGVYDERAKDANWMNSGFRCGQRVKFDLFKRFGYIAAAGDRHLAEFSPAKWYLESPEAVNNWGFGLTSVDWRKSDLKKRLEKSEKLRNGELKVELNETGEEGVNQMRALLGLHKFTTNVNIPNTGQITNLPLGAVVETNAVFSADSVVPVQAGDVPKEIYGMIARVVSEQEVVAEAGMERNVEKAFRAFINDPLFTGNLEIAKKLFNEMLQNTKKYLLPYGYDEDKLIVK